MTPQGRSKCSWTLGAAVTVALLLPITSHAWKHTGNAWTPDDMPLQYYVASAECEESVPPDYCEEVTKQGWQAWMEVPCTDFDAEYVGTCENSGYAPSDLQNRNTFNDPADDLETGVLAATLTSASGTAFLLHGESYAHSYDSDIVWNDNVVFDTHENVIGGTCNGGHDMLGVATHEIGHSVGMGHSCEEDEVCTDIALREATMFWQGPACDDGQAGLDDDDVESFTALYGPFATFVCSHQIDESLAIGVVPFELKCAISSEQVSDLTSASWQFGDGGTSEELAAAHVYEVAGNYTVQVTVTGEGAGCDEEGWAYDYRRVGYVRACDVPAPAFTTEHVDGLTYQMLNESDVSVYGCISAISWVVYKGNGTSGKPLDDLGVSAWEPLITFPEEGTYTVVANLGGIAGTGAAKMTFEVKKRRGEGYGCDATGASGVGVWGLMLAGLGLFRRRR
jgi:uncharacterized protein (TIGR03382 family)